MDLKPASQDVQPVMHRAMNQTAHLGHRLATGLSQAASEVEAHAKAFWKDSTELIARHSPGIVPPAEPARLAPGNSAGKKLLIIGDSQTVGPYGKALDGLARASHAKVSTHASWGASPYWFFTGQQTHHYWTRDTAGQEANRSKAATPRLEALLAAERPDVVVVTMGGNLIAGNASQAEVTKQVSQIGNAVSASGARLVWVGPPKYDPKTRSPEQVEQFYQKLRNIVPEYGTLIDSRPHIEDYAGSDGLHYSGPKGERIAREWAQGVFQQIQQIQQIQQNPKRD